MELSAHALQRRLCLLRRPRPLQYDSGPFVAGKLVLSGRSRRGNFFVFICLCNLCGRRGRGPGAAAGSGAGGSAASRIPSASVSIRVSTKRLDERVRGAGPPRSVWPKKIFNRRLGLSEKNWEIMRRQNGVGQVAVAVVMMPKPP